MFRKLPLNKRYTDCTRCNYGGCITYGHWNWTVRLAYRAAKKWLKTKWEKLTALDYSKIDDVELDGIQMNDYPDFCDAYIASASYKGRDMTDKELERLNQDSDFVYEQVLKRIY